MQCMTRGDQMSIVRGGDKDRRKRSVVMAPPSSCILEPTPIDPRRIVIVPNVPLDSSRGLLVGNKKIVDETVLSALRDVLNNSSSTSSSTPILPGLSPNVVTSSSLLLDVASIICNHTDVDEHNDFCSATSHDDCIEMWRQAGGQVQKPQKNNMDFVDHDGKQNKQEDDASSKKYSAPWGVRLTANPSKRHLSPCCSPEPSASCCKDNSTIHAQNKSSRSSVVVTSSRSDKVKLLPTIGDSRSTNGGSPSSTFRIQQTELWYQRYLDLLKFAKVYGNCLVPLNWPKNPPLAHWVKRQRHQYRAKQQHKHSTLTDERQRLLEELGFVWDSHASMWEEHLKELQDFKGTHGHCRVPKTYAANPQLAVWVKCQRRQFKLYSEGKDSNMRIERIHKLRKIGFVFSPRKQRESSSFTSSP